MQVTNKKLVLISQAAKILNVSIDTIRRWDKAGKLHSTRPDGKNRYFSISELEEIKYGKPLPISAAAKSLDISVSTLRRLEKRGLIKPGRTKGGSRAYDKKSLEGFLNSEYFLREKTVEEKAIESFQAPIPETSKKVLGLETWENRQSIEGLKLFRKSFYFSGLFIATSAVLIIGIITLLFLFNTDQTAKLLGYQTNKNSNVLGVQSQKDSKLIAQILRPFSQVSLGLVKQIDPPTYAKVVQENLNLNNYISVTSNHELVTSIPVRLSSDQLVMSDSGLVDNLNAEYVQGKVPGENDGDLAVLGQGGMIDGLVVDYVAGSVVQLSSSSGLVNSSGLSLLRTCGTDQVLIWNGSSWVCANKDASGYITASSTETLTNKSGNISMWTNNSGYIVSSSTLNGLVASTTSGNSYFMGGNLGVGTSSPNYNFDVIGQINGSTGVCINGDCKTTWPVSTSYTSSNGITLTGTNFTLGGQLSQATGIDINSQNFGFLGGNVGIGTTSPIATFDLRGAQAAADSSTYSFYVSGSTANSVTDASGEHAAIKFAVDSGTGSSGLYKNALVVDYAGSWTGGTQSSSGYFLNSVPGTGTGWLKGNINSGVYGSVTPSTTGKNAAVLGFAGAGAVNFGVLGISDYAYAINKTNIGVAGVGYNSGTGTVQVGGFFTLQAYSNDAGGTPTNSAALIADNSIETSPIFLAQDNGSTIFVINDGGNVGIGFTSPAATLDVIGTSMLRGTNGVYGLTVGSNGNVGIGLTNPNYALDVNGTINATAIKTPYQHTITVAKSGGDYTTITAALAAITDNSSTNLYLIKVMPGTYSEGATVTMKQYVDIEGSGVEVTKISYDGGGNNNNYVLIAASNSKISHIQLSSINKASVIYLNSATAFTADYIKILGDGGGSSFATYGGGTLTISNSEVTGTERGISTTSGTVTLINNYIHGLSATYDDIETSATINSYNNRLEGNYAFSVTGTINSYNDFYTGSIDNTGGTFNKKDYYTDPNYQSAALYPTQAVLPLGARAMSGLNANGTYLGINAAASYAGDFANFLLNGISKFTVTGAGNVGIGTSFPSQLFQINTSTSNPFVVTSGGNVGIGTTTPTATLQIVGSADQAQLAVVSNSTQTTAPFILQNSDGTIGIEIRVGGSGKKNTFIGIDAGKVATGGNNTVLGYYAGQKISTGSQNALFGDYNGTALTTGTRNTFLGSYAGVYTVGGSSNVFIGADAGTNNNANYNVFIGDGAGKNNTGSSNVFLGNNAGSNETGSNKLYIANSSSTPLIYGDFSTGNVGIGTTGPIAKLQIFGTNALNTTLALKVSGFATGDDIGPGLVVTNLNQVGIGTATPGTVLPPTMETNGTILEIVPSQGYNTDAGIAIRSNPSPGWGTKDSHGIDIWHSWWGTTGDAGQVYIDSRVNSSVAGYGINFRARTAGTPITTMFLENTGNVGIGTITPLSTLQVNGNIGIGTTVAQASLYVQGNAMIGYASGAPASLANGLAVSGNVGIGTTGPAYKFTVRSSGGYDAFYVDDAGNVVNNGSFLQFANSGELILDSGSTRRISNYNSGIVIKTDDSSYNLKDRIYIPSHVDTAQIAFMNSNVGIGTILPTGIFQVNPTSGTTPFVVTSTGNVGIGTTNPTAALMVNGGALIGYTSSTGAGAPTNGLAISGNVGIGTTNPTAQLELSGSSAIKASGTTWDNPSDARLKDVLGSYGKGLDEILKVNTIRYSFKEGNALGLAYDGEHIGIIAQEIQSVFPEAVKMNSNGYLTFNADPVIWASVNAIKDLNTKVTVLEEKVASSSATPSAQLTNKVTINDLTAKVAQLEEELTMLVTRIVEFFGKVFFHGPVTFISSVIFPQDMGGMAIIKASDTEVEIKFTQVFEEIPMVTISRVVDDIYPEATTGAKFKQDFQAVIINKSANGFIIKLSNPVSIDLKFSWTALAIKDAKVTVSSSGNEATDSASLAAVLSAEASSSAVLGGSTSKEASVSASEVEPLKEATPSAILDEVIHIKINENELGFLRVRELPTATSLEVAQVKPNDEYATFEQKDGWYLIEYEEGKYGWIKGSYVSVFKLEDLPLQK